MDQLLDIEVLRVGARRADLHPLGTTWPLCDGDGGLHRPQCRGPPTRAAWSFQRNKYRLPLRFVARVRGPGRGLQGEIHLTASWTATRRLLVLAAAAFAAMLLGAGNAGAATPGDPTIQVPINDSTSGASYTQTFVRAFAGETEDGTDIYIYVPAGALTGVAGVAASTRSSTRTRATSSCRARRRRTATTRSRRRRSTSSATRSQNQIVRVDEAHFGQIGLAERATRQRRARRARLQRSGRLLLRLRRDVVHGRLLRAGLHLRPWHERDRHRRARLGEASADGKPTASIPDTRASSPTSSSTCSWSTRTRPSVVGRRGPRRHGRLPQRLPGGALARMRLPPGLPPRDLADPLGRRPRELRGGATRYFLYLWERAGGDGRRQTSRRTSSTTRPGDALIKLIFAEQRRQPGGRRGGDPAVQRAAGGRPAEREAAVPGLGRRASTSTTRARSFGFQNLDFGSEATRGATRSTSRTTSSGTAAASTRARCPSRSGARTTSRRRSLCRSARRTRCSGTRARRSPWTSAAPAGRGHQAARRRRPLVGGY